MKIPEVQMGEDLSASHCRSTFCSADRSDDGNRWLHLSTTAVQTLSITSTTGSSSPLVRPVRWSSLGWITASLTLWAQLWIDLVESTWRGLVFGHRSATSWVIIENSFDVRGNYRKIWGGVWLLSGLGQKLFEGGNDTDRASPALSLRQHEGRWQCPTSLSETTTINRLINLEHLKTHLWIGDWGSQPFSLAVPLPPIE